MKLNTSTWMVGWALGTMALALGACGKAAPPGVATATSAPSGGPGSSAEPAARPSQGTLPTMPALVLPADPQREAKIALGRALFFDKRMSVDGTRACYSCHLNEDGNGGHDPLAIGPGEKPLTRHSPVLWNVAYYQGSLYWDGRAKDLEANAKGAWGGPNMAVGLDNLEAKAAEIAAIPGYKPLFDAAFPGAEIKAPLFFAALAEYERTMICNDTAYDRFAAGKKDALSEAQQRGLDLFMGKAACTTCHAPPFFSNAMGVAGGAYFNVGIGTELPPEAQDKVDVGRMKITNATTDWAAFKPPSLRNVTRSAPYFHNGSVATLDEAVRLMMAGGIPNKNKSPAALTITLSDAERADLIAFLGALDCPNKLEAPTLP